ncbi:50S ribosomal protein L10, partial [Candidatus Saccharibacteria bacterium]|nr:50S ribosomal protein L10 [Calditrichia bacterium]NIV98513.1 50S ribosomal protein L10 [Candidatus Saccharibacteria bacterium]
MPTAQKEAIVQEMTEKFSNAKSIFLADFTGVDVNTITKIRKSFREADVEYRVVKNTLAKLSFNNSGIEGLNDYLVGVNSYAISYDDPIVPLKVLDKLKKDLDGKFSIKAAYLEGQVVGAEKMEAISKLPSKTELLGQLVGMLQSPMSKFVGTLQASMNNLVRVLKSLEEAKK